jgi:flavin-dependent dehydrogenase
MQSPKEIDLIIIGSGPAGLSTALHLVKIDPAWVKRMVVLEKAIHPRLKHCGGGLTRFGIRILQDLGFRFPISVPCTRVDRVNLKYRNRVIHIQGNPQFMVFSRPEFDHFLADQARKHGVTILEDQAVESLAVRPQGVTVTTNKIEYWAKAVVGADGSLGTVRQSLAGYKNPGQVARTLKFHNPATPTSERFVEHSAIFDFTLLEDNLQGYIWDFPAIVESTPVHNRGIYDSRCIKSRPRADLSALLGKGFQHTDSLPATDHLSGYPIRVFSPTNQISGNRILLVGDAAGADILFGEGIGPALGYGKVAASVITHAFNENDFRFSNFHKVVLHSSLGRYLFHRWLLAKIVYRLAKVPGFLHLLWTACQILATIWRAGPIDGKQKRYHEK